MKLIFVLTGPIKGEQEKYEEGDAKRKRKEVREGEKVRSREKESAASSGSTLKLTKEFRFLYNRFNLILVLDRSGEDVNEERISISERYSPPRLRACPRYLPRALSYMPLPLRLATFPAPHGRCSCA